jgi:hypothetical protein
MPMLGLLGNFLVAHGTWIATVALAFLTYLYLQETKQQRIITYAQFVRATAPQLHVVTPEPFDIGANMSTKLNVVNRGGTANNVNLTFIVLCCGDPAEQTRKGTSERFSAEWSWHQGSASGDIGLGFTAGIVGKDRRLLEPASGLSGIQILSFARLTYGVPPPSPSTSSQEAIVIAERSFWWNSEFHQWMIASPRDHKLITGIVAQDEASRSLSDPYDSLRQPADPNTPILSPQRPQPDVIINEVVPFDDVVRMTLPNVGLNMTGTRWIQVASGWRNFCALTTGGLVKCGGANAKGQSGPPQSKFTAIASGSEHGCALTEDRHVICWGDNSEGQSAPPQGVLFTQISAGGRHTCGIRPNGTATCWGSNRYGQAEPPEAHFSRISAGATHTCGVTDDDSILCWGDNTYGQCSSRDRHYQQVVAGYLQTCGFNLGGPIAWCWGINGEQQLTVVGGLKEIALGQQHTCLLNGDNRARCYGSNDLQQAEQPEGEFSHVVAGARHTCWLGIDGSLQCHGDISVFGK